MTPGRKTGKDRLSRAEIRKDAVQETFTATTNAVGAVAGIVVGAVGDIGRAVGGYATELFEIRESSRRAASDHEVDLVDVPARGRTSPATSASRRLSSGAPRSTPRRGRGRCARRLRCAVTRSSGRGRRTS